MLSYARQVLELEKIAALEPRRPAQLPLPELAASTEAACVVCGQACGRLCAGCEEVAYCTPQHQQVDWVWHAAACGELSAMAADRAFWSGASAEHLLAQLLRCAGEREATDLASWEQFLGVQEARALRALSALGSRPLTLACLLRDLGLSTPGAAASLRVHVVAASEPEQAAAEAFRTVMALCPQLTLDLALFGPELPPGPDLRAERLRVLSRPGLYRRSSWLELGRPDLVVGFNAGLLLYRSWEPTLLDLVGSGVPLAITSYRAWEAEAEGRLLQSFGARPLLPPAPNPFASRSSRRSSTLVNDFSRDNSILAVWRWLGVSGDYQPGDNASGWRLLSLSGTARGYLRRELAGYLSGARYLKILNFPAWCGVGNHGTSARASKRRYSGLVGAGPSSRAFKNGAGGR